MDEKGNGGEINPVGDTGDQIVSGTTEDIVEIMDRDKVGEEIITEGDMGHQIVSRPTEVIVENMDKDRVGREIIPEEQRYGLLLPLPLPLTASARPRHCPPSLPANPPSATLTEPGIMDENGNGGDTGDQIVSGPTEEIIGIMDKDRVGEEIITEEDTGEEIEVIVEIMDRDRVGEEIITEEDTGDQIEVTVEIMDKDRVGGEIIPEGGTGDQIVLEPTEDWSSVVQCPFSQAPTLLRASAGHPACCIYRVPRSLATAYEKAFKPQIVSIGPYHHGRECTKMVEEHKAQFFAALLARTNDRGVHLNDYFKSIACKEGEIRECYSEPLELGRSDLVEMMVLDGCFVIEWFRVMGSILEPDNYGPIICFPGISRLAITDFIQLENQIPFFVLDILYELSKSPEDPRNFQTLVLDIYNTAFRYEEQVMRPYYDIPNSVHLLHLLHSSFAHFPTESLGDVRYDYRRLVYSAKELKLAGIKFKPRTSPRFLDVSFTNGVLEVPSINLDDTMVAFLGNCLAFEQGDHMRMSQNITCYVTLLGKLISNSEDAALLSELQIMKDIYFGSNDAVARFFWDMGREMMFDMRRSYLAKLLLDMEEYANDQWHLRLTRMKLLILLSIGVMLLLVLTVVQTVFAGIAYFRPPK